MHMKRNLSGRRTSLYPFTIEMEQDDDCEEMEEVRIAEWRQY